MEATKGFVYVIPQELYKTEKGGSSDAAVFSASHQKVLHECVVG